MRLEPPYKRLSRSRPARGFWSREPGRAERSSNYEAAAEILRLDVPVGGKPLKRSSRAFAASGALRGSTIQGLAPFFWAVSGSEHGRRVIEELLAARICESIPGDDTQEKLDAEEAKPGAEF